MIPMGTVMTVCMILGVIMGSKPPAVSHFPHSLQRATGLVVLVAGVWNVFWYGLQHLTEFWGLAALISGILMMVTATYILDEKSVPQGLHKLRPWVLLSLLACALTYGITIARL